MQPFVFFCIYKILTEDKNSKLIKAMLRFILSIAIFSCVLIACKKDKSNITSTPTSPILFQMDYQNYAWGFAHSGWFIDNEGQLYAYNLSENDPWAEIQNGQIFADSLNMNFNYSNDIGSIELDSVLHYYNWAIQMMNDSITPPETIMADAGIHNYYAYQYESSCNCYNTVLIKRYGDIMQSNTGANAEAVYHWMQNLAVILWEN